MHCAQAGDCAKPDRVLMFGDNCFVHLRAAADALFGSFARREAPKTTREEFVSRWTTVLMPDLHGKGERHEKKEDLCVLRGIERPFAQQQRV